MPDSTFGFGVPVDAVMVNVFDGLGQQQSQRRLVTEFSSQNLFKKLIAGNEFDAFDHFQATLA